MALFEASLAGVFSDCAPALFSAFFLLFADLQSEDEKNPLLSCIYYAVLLTTQLIT